MSLDRNLAAQHNEPVSTILLQENSFKPAQQRAFFCLLDKHALHYCKEAVALVWRVRREAADRFVSSTVQRTRRSDRIPWPMISMRANSSGSIEGRPVWPYENQPRTAETAVLMGLGEKTNPCVPHVAPQQPNRKAFPLSLARCLSEIDPSIIAISWMKLFPYNRLFA
jgi:hypothetical protein